MSAASDSTGHRISQQEYDPWGKLRPVTGSATTTQQSKHNYTGQRLDDTGLLFYNARYYDPGVGRFTSPDSIVPGASLGAGGALGTVGTWQNSRLTVDFHEGGFLSSVQGENALTLQKGFWFQLSGQDKGRADPSGPYNPQALNRYAYTLNNPIRYLDPTGHAWVSAMYLDPKSALPVGTRVTLSRKELKGMLDWIDRHSNVLYTGAGGLAAFIGGIAGAPGGPVVSGALALVFGTMTVKEIEDFINFMKDVYARGGTIEIETTLAQTLLSSSPLGFLFGARPYTVHEVSKEDAARVPEGVNKRDVCKVGEKWVPCKR